MFYFFKLNRFCFVLELLFEISDFPKQGLDFEHLPGSPIDQQNHSNDENPKGDEEQPVKAVFR